MRLKKYAEKDDSMRVWLSEKELQRIIPRRIEKAGTDTQLDKHQQRRAALMLAGRCGLRRQEVVNVAPKDIVRSDHGRVVRVWDGKGSKYREVPAPGELADLIIHMDRDKEEPLVSVVDSTIYDWVEQEATRCYSETGDEGWQYVGPHDLRRSWGVRTLESGVLPSVVMEWGGWEDFKTFRDHYLAEFSPEALRRERGKVSWLGGEPDSGAQPYNVVSAGRSSAGEPRGSR